MIIKKITKAYTINCVLIPNKLRREYTLVNDLWIGTDIGYHTNGKVHWRDYEKWGRVIGPSVTYTRDNKLEQIEYFL